MSCPSLRQLWWSFCLPMARWFHIACLLLFVRIVRTDRSLQTTIQPNVAPITTNFDASLALSEDISADDARIKKQGLDCALSEQVHLTYWSSTSLLVSWASCDAVLGSAHPVATGTAVSVVWYGTTPHLLDSRAEGIATSYAVDYTGLGASYASPVLHHVLLTGLTPGTTYHYKVSHNTSSGTDRAQLSDDAGRMFSFTVPKPASFPLRLGVIGDPGQTHNTSTTLKHLIASDPQLVALLGDFAYADNWLDAHTELPSELYGQVTCQPKHDTWGRLFEPLLSHVPLLHVNGNHEIEQQRNGDRNTAYNHRFPTPQLSGHDYNKGPSHFTPVSPARPFSNLYYTVDVPGVMRYVALTSYAPGQTFGQHEEQYRWLEQELQQVDRVRSPWLVVAIHAPFYHTYAGHYKEVECMRQSYEPLFVRHGVDLVLSGHVHAYERTKGVVNYQVDACGPMYITVGDGGNVEGLYKDFIDLPTAHAPAFCTDPQAFSNKLFPWRYQPQACYSFQDGKFCAQQQPAWSAYREPSFGFGTLEFLSPTTAKWTWRKNQWPAWQSGDEVTITRGGGSQLCGSTPQHAAGGHQVERQMES